MATTKEAARADLATLLAEEYLSDLIYGALLERGEPAKASEITLEINNERITFPVVRRVLSDSPRFLSVDRMWNLASRYLDKGRPTERNLQEVLRAAGRPLSTAQLATELSTIYDRPGEVYLSLLSKITRNRDYLITPVGVAPRAWLPLVDADEEEDILFDNEVSAAQVAIFAAQNVTWSAAAYAETTRAIVAAAPENQPVPHRILGVLAWRSLREKYDPQKHLLACLADPELVWLSGGRWITRSRADALEALLAERGAQLATEEPVEEPSPIHVADGRQAKAAAAATTPSAAPESAAAAAPVEAEAAPEAVPAAAPPVPVREPLSVTEEDLSALEQLVAGRETAVDAVDLLALHYEVVPGDPSFRDDVATLTEALRGNVRFLYVGSGRFREPNSLPLYVFTVPESLGFPDLQFVSLEGEIMDEEIEDEGFAGSLRSELRNPLAQDVGDDEGHYTGEPPADMSSIRLVLKAHHKEIGTFPLCQVPDGFFPNDAPVVEVTIKDPTGGSHEIIVNNELRIAFNLFGLYDLVPADSGGVFRLERTARPYEYRFVPGEENDPQVYLSPARMDELLALREQAEETGDMATFDIVCEVLAHHNRGLDFVAAMAEVNVVRRVTRRRLASILSNYFCFSQRPGQPLWRYDVKKRDLGTDRAKRKYLKR